MRQETPPIAIVMNMFGTGLGIARSLGEHGVPVVGLSAQHGVYGNFTRYAKILFCPDSRTRPEPLRDFLFALGKQMGNRAVIFPTRDDDVLFLDRYRSELNQYFSLVIPESTALQVCLDKWETYRAAVRAAVPVPRCWRIDGEQRLEEVIAEVTYPCVLKPVSAYHWRQGDNWEIVGARKAIGISSRQELLAEYATVAKAGKPVLLQEMIVGGDESLVITACYLDLRGRWVAGFNTQKLVQVPEMFGTGCIVRAASYPELTAPTVRLLESIGFTGIAEVEYKWDAAKKQYALIEINPRPWDQHRLGATCGVDLAYLSYCDHAGLPRPAIDSHVSVYKWIAEDAFVNTAVSLLWRRDSKLRSLLHLARGRRIYAVWCLKDPLPFLANAVFRFIPALFVSGARRIWSGLKTKTIGARHGAEQEDRSLCEPFCKR
jgi:predicted ATP-grasp superfamily ATP-dependent carboligase